MLDMGSKVTDAILNDKFKIKCFLFLSLNLEIESYFSKFNFPLSNYKHQVQSPSPDHLSPTTGDLSSAQDSNVIQVNTERKRVGILF